MSQSCNLKVKFSFHLTTFARKSAPIVALKPKYINTIFTQAWMFEKDVPHEFIMIKKFNILYEKIAKNDDNIIERLPDEEIMKEVKKVKNGKAPDLLNTGKENIVHADNYIQGMFCSFVNDMITDPKKYSASLASTSVASFLFKGKDLNSMCIEKKSAQNCPTNPI